MDKTDYIQLRNENRLNDIAFSYYKEKGGTSDFETAMKSGLFSTINFDSLLHELDIRFEVTLVLKDNILIKVQ